MRRGYAARGTGAINDYSVHLKASVAQLFYRSLGFKDLLTSQEICLNSVTFDVISGIKCYQFNEFDAS